MRTRLLLTLGTLAVLLGCARETLENERLVPQGNTTLRATVSEAVQSRTAFTDAGAFSWTAADAISVYTTKGAFRTFTLTGGDGTASGVFTGDFTDETTSTLAVYPASESHSLSGNALTLHLDDSYTWSEDLNSHAPMMAVIASEGAESFSFKHLGGILKVSFSNVPATATKFVFTAEGRKVSGDFAVADITEENAVIATAASEEGNTVTINIPKASAEMAFYVPLPTGTYPGFSVELFDAAGNPLVMKTRYSEITIARKDLVLMKLIAGAATNGKKLLFDFGHKNDGNCPATTSPDANGNYWNNIEKASSGKNGNGLSFDLAYSDNSATPYKLTLLTDFWSNGKANGGLAVISDATAAALGDLAIVTATQDYFFSQGAAVSCTFELSGLNPAKGYKFHLFGSRASTVADQKREAKYAIAGANAFEGLLCITGPGAKGTQNTTDVLESDIIYPKPDGTIKLTLSKGTNSQASGTNEYYQLNCMKVEEFEGGQIPVTVNYTSLQVTSAEETFLMHRVEGDANIFEGVSSFSSGEVSMKGITDKGVEVPLTATSTVDGVAYFVADLDKAEYTFTAVDAILAQGPAILGWSNSNGAALDYKGAGVFSGTALEFGGNGAPKYDRSQSFNFVKRGAWSPTFKRVTGTRRDIEASSYGTTQDINLNPGVYDVSLDLRNFKYEMAHHGDLDPDRITVMGSSVPYGQGATNKHGYIWLYEDVLKARTGNSWYISNLSVSGNNTTTLGERFDEETVDGGKYLIVALSLGNEGLASATTSSAMETLYNQWENRVMLDSDSFVKTARAEGKQVVVTGNYANNGYNSDHYSWIRQINLDIQQWDVPSVNLMGAIDDGTGKWAAGYYDDDLHPNDAGHLEMACAVVPSLFDALKAGKAQPVRSASGSYTLSNRQVIAVEPEGRIHPFTISFGVKTTAAGSILTFFNGEEARTVSVSASGTLTYGTVTGTRAVNDGAWHQVTLTHFYARGETLLYVDGLLQGSVSEKVLTTAFYVGYAGAATQASWREIFFWRSGMNADEVSAISYGKMLKSSLEFYAPLDGALTNLAQSTNTLDIADGASLVPAEDTTPRLNGEALTEAAGVASIGKISLTQGSTLTLSNLGQVSDYWWDPDYFEVNGSTVTFLAVSGDYDVAFHPGYVTAGRVTSDGNKPDIENGGLYLLGWGVANPVMNGGQFGWTLSNAYRIAQVAANVYQFSGYAVAETSDLIGGRFRTDYTDGKYFYAYNSWDGQGPVTFTERAAELLVQSSGNNFNYAKNLEEGAFYVLRIDFTGCTISGTTVTGTPTVDFYKK